MKNLKFLVFGTLFGILLTKGEVISWWRIQEMFRFESFHMYGFIGSAILVGFIGVRIIKAFQLKSIRGESIILKPKSLNVGTVVGGTLFGFGWALTGACPGPLYAHIGMGNTTFIVTIVSALLGTFVYGVLRPRLPHGELLKRQRKENYDLSSPGKTETLHGLKNAS